MIKRWAVRAYTRSGGPMDFWFTPTFLTRLGAQRFARSHHWGYDVCLVVERR